MGNMAAVRRFFYLRGGWLFGYYDEETGDIYRALGVFGCAAGG